MEKRVLIAFLLTWMVLVIFQRMNTKQQEQSLPPTEKITQPIGIEEVAEDSRDKELAKMVESESVITEPVEPSITQHVETKELEAQFSNVGGKLNKVILKKYDYTFPLKDFYSLDGYSGVRFNVASEHENSIKYIYEDSDLRIIKYYEFDKEFNEVNMEIEIENLSDRTINKKFLLNNFTIDSSLLSKKNSHPRDKTLLEYSISQDGKVRRKSNASKFSDKENTKEFGLVSWAGFRNRYFCAVVIPNYATDSYLLKAIESEKLQIINESQEVKLNPGDSFSFSSSVYFGPQDLKKFELYKPEYAQIVSFSRFKLLDSISKGSLKLMHLLHRFIPVWGICIILMGALVSLAMYPLTLKSMTSMKKMQSLKPVQDKLREQYKNNPQRLNKEIMGLYKKHNINPLGGCLPLFLQMPIFIGLYQALWRSVSFKGASFLWIKDLSEPDRLFTLPFTLPIIGNEINILPILMMILMVFQQRFSAKNMVATDPNQIMQQKIMSTFFPVFIGFIFYKFSSGLALYFTVFYMFSTFTQWKLSKVKQEI